jgi:serine/threonine protein kinase
MKGQVVDGRYEVLGRLGAGGMATIYLVEDRQRKKKLALKVMRSTLTDPTIKKRFVREFEACARLKHENIVKLYDLGESDGSNYYTMEYLPHASLEAVLEQKGTLPEEETYLLVEQLARAFDFYHQEGVVHRDLKPANIIMSPQGRLVIVDFGLARDAEMTALTQTGTMLGTPRYMPPEQIRGERADAKSDIWALGVIIFEVLTGRKLFQGEDLTAIMTSVVCAKIPLLKDVAPHLKWDWQPLINACLQREKDERLASGKAVHELLRNVKNQKEITRPKIAPKQEKTKQERTQFQTKPWPLVAVVIVLLLGIGSFYLGSSPIVVTDLKVEALPRRVVVTWKSEQPYISALLVESPTKREVKKEHGKAVLDHALTISGLKDNQECSFRLLFPNGKSSSLKRAKAKSLSVKMSASIEGAKRKLTFQLNYSPALLQLRCPKRKYQADSKGKGHYLVTIPKGQTLGWPLKLVIIEDDDEIHLSVNELLNDEVVTLNRKFTTFNGEKIVYGHKGTLHSRLRNSTFFPLYERARALAPLVLPNDSLPFETRLDLFAQLRHVWDIYLYAVFEKYDVKVAKPDFGPFDMVLNPYGKAAKDVVILEGVSGKFYIGGKVAFDPRKVISHWQKDFVVEGLSEYGFAEIELTVSSLNRIALELTLNKKLSVLSYGLPLLQYPYIENQKVYQRIPVQCLREGKNSLKIKASQVYKKGTTRKVTISAITLRLYPTRD